MMRVGKLIVLQVFLCLFSIEVRAQSLQIVSTSPAEDATNVPLQHVVTFHLSKPLPSFGSAFVSKFFWSPREATQLTRFGHDFDDEGRLTEVFFTLEHEPNTDFSFVVFGVEAADGSRMARPFTLNYTTRQTTGDRNVSGSVSFGPRALSSAATKALALERLIQRSLLHARIHSGRSNANVTLHGTKGVAGRKAYADYRSVAQKAAQQDINRTVVLLLDQYAVDQNQWSVRKAAVPDVEGRFTFDHVEEGSYYPVAIGFGDPSGASIDYFGFYDGNGDLQPDPVAVESGDIADVDLTLFGFGPITAGAYLDLARQLAAGYAPDQQLVDIKALRGSSIGYAYPDGTAELWRYTFVSSSLQQITYLALDAVNFYDDVTSTSQFATEPLPATIIDSDQAIGIADANGGLAFRAQYPDQDVRVSLQAGDLPLPVRPPPGRPFWLVTYEAPAGSPSNSLAVFLDVETGETLEASPVSVAESPFPEHAVLEPAYPNPFTNDLSIPITMSASSPVSLQIVDVLGRVVETIAEEDFAPGTRTLRWNRGGHPNGLYFVRLFAQGQVYVQPVSLIR